MVASPVFCTLLARAAAQSDSDKAVRDAQSQIKGAVVSLAKIEAKLGITGSGNSTNSTNTTKGSP